MPHTCSGNLPIRASKPRISIESRQGLLVWRFWTMGAVIWRPQKWQPCLSNRGIRGIWKNLWELFSMSFNSFEMLTWCVVCLFVPDDWKRAMQPNPQQKNRKESQNPTNNWNFEGTRGTQNGQIRTSCWKTPEVGSERSGLIWNINQCFGEAQTHPEPFKTHKFRWRVFSVVFFR